MATQQPTNDDKPMRGGMEGDVGSPMTNDAYNLIAALHEKLQGLEAMRKFSKDANVELWKELTRLDHQAVMRLCDELEKMVRDGKFRAAMTPQKPSAKS